MVSRRQSRGKIMDLNRTKTDAPIVERIAAAEEVVWINPRLGQKTCQNLSKKDIQEASDRLKRFAPLIMKLFPETIPKSGMIESELTEIPNMKSLLKEKYNADLGGGRLFLKRDSDLAIAGSVKARGGIYEVLKHTEDLALENGLISGEEDDYTKLADDKVRRFFSQFRVQVGSTGNLGVSIGIMSAALGYQAIVHMSSDAKQWKKDYLRSHGVTVVEYAGDYGSAVEEGRAESDRDPMSYFVDDENSVDLFLGYAVSAERLDRQLCEAGVSVDEDHPLFVYIPCGVGGAPGGVTFGLKEKYGSNVHVFFAEPVQACCMLLGLATGLHNGICVQDVGLTGKTHADGLAVARPSGFVGSMMEPLLSGEVTIEDAKLYDFMRGLWNSEGIFIEPSACAAFQGVCAIGSREMQDYFDHHQLRSKLDDAVHIAWATGGKLVPEEMRREFFDTRL
jgi:D-serine dehydratase